MIKIECNTWDELMELIKKMIGTTEGTSAASKQQEPEQRIMQVVTPAVIKPMNTPLAPIPDAAPENTTPPWAPENEDAALKQRAPEPAPARTVTRQEVQAKAIALMDAKKQDQLQALLKKYNVPALPSIPEDQLAAFMSDLEAM